MDRLRGIRRLFRLGDVRTDVPCDIEEEVRFHLDRVVEDAVRHDPAGSLRSGGQGAGRGPSRMRSALLVGQAALSVDPREALDAE